MKNFLTYHRTAFGGFNRNFIPKKSDPPPRFLTIAIADVHCTLSRSPQSIKQNNVTEI